MKPLWQFDLQSRTNLSALIAIGAGLGKLFFPEVFHYDGDPVQMMLLGAGMIYLRESVENAK